MRCDGLHQLALDGRIDRARQVTVRYDDVETHEPFDSLRKNVSKSDWVVLAGADVATEALKRVPGIPDQRFLVAVAAHSASTTHGSRR
jgi:hypothetical protein